MSTFVAIVGAWFLVSLPFGILLGRIFATGDDRDLSDYVISPDDRGQR